MRPEIKIRNMRYELRNLNQKIAFENISSDKKTRKIHELEAEVKHLKETISESKKEQHKQET